jgi:hypothetical protein|tara:strand:+ start:199 stop:576 length:378 start_codon:yes stop_codon:yes gene_type:complete
MLQELLGGLGGKVVDAVSARGARKHEEKVKILEIEAAKHKTKLEMAMKGQQMDNSWELEQIKNSGWKDEFVLLILSIPLVLSFIPGTVGYVENGFRALSLTPDWYQWLILAVFAAIYGIRIWRRK